MELRILGPLEAVDDDGQGIHLGGPRVRAVLGRLALQPNTVVATDTLIDAVWGETPPSSAPGALQVHVHALRKSLGADRIVTRAPGYMLRLEHDELDATRFETLLEEGAQLQVRGDHAAASSALSRALALWRGPALADLAYESFAQREAERLNELRLVAVERRLEAEVELGRHAELVGELEALAAEHPLRERFCALLMLALYRSNRQAEALATYRAAREVLVEELGIEPGTELRELEQAILRQDAALQRFAAQPAQRLSPSSPLVGRERELAAVTALLRRPDARLVTLTGAGGTGKTRLALAAADELGRAVLVDLAPLSDPELVLPTIASGLGVDDSGESVVKGLAAALAVDPPLLVLDNLEHLPAAHPHVGALVAAAPNVKVLATSRAPLRLAAEHEYRVAPLDIPAQGAATASDIAAVGAVRLYVDRVRGVVPSFELSDENAPAVARICRGLDGLPLALELAAARVRVLGPEGTARRLGESLALLARDAPDLPPRQRSLRATIEWSYELLHEDARTVFRHLGVFAGSVTLEATEHVAGTDPTDAVEALLDAALVIHVADAAGEPRFAMLETIREYALERLVEHGEVTRARDRHLEHYLGKAESVAQRESATGQTPVLLDEAEAQLAELRAALSHAQTLPEPDRELRLVVALRFYFRTRGQGGEGQRATAAAFARSAEAPPLLRAHVFVEHGVYLTDVGASETGIAVLEEALAVLEEAGDLTTAGRIHAYIGSAYAQEGELERSIGHFERSIALLTEVGDARRRAHALTQLADVRIRLGTLDLARAHLLEALEALGTLPTNASFAYTLYMLGCVEWRAGQPTEAASWARRALPAILELRFHELLAYELVFLADVLLDASPEGAARLLGAAEEELRRADIPIQPSEGERVSEMKEKLAETIGGGDVEGLVADGAALTMDEAVTLALELLEPVSEPASPP